MKKYNSYKKYLWISLGCALGPVLADVILKIPTNAMKFLIMWPITFVGILFFDKIFTKIRGK